MRITLSIFFVFCFHFSVAQLWQDAGGGINGSVRCLYIDSINDLLYAGGQFDSAGLVGANNIASWNGNSWNAFGNNSSLHGNAESIESITIFNNEIIIGGLFDSVGSVPAKNIARWDGSQWRSMGNGLDGGSVSALQVYNGDLYAGGNFTYSNFDTLSYIAIWDGTTWQEVIDGLNSQVFSMCVYNGILIIGGYFNNTLGQSFPANSVVGFDGTGWVSLGGGFSTATFALRVLQDTLYAVGNFTNNITNINYITKWNDTSWLAHPYPGGGTQPWVTDIAMYSDEVYVCGYFTTPPDIAKFNGTTFDSVGDAFGYVKRMAIYKDELYVAGSFANINGIPLGNIARFNQFIGIEDFNIKSYVVKLFPNPARNGGYINLINLSVPLNPLILSDEQGRFLQKLIQYDEVIKLPDDISPGIYFVTGTDKYKKSFLFKLIIY